MTHKKLVPKGNIVVAINNHLRLLLGSSVFLWIFTGLEPLSK